MTPYALRAAKKEELAGKVISKTWWDKIEAAR
jgi:hypothetical protein